MRCPKCAGAMEQVDHGSVSIERCVTCRGLWFDVLEHEDLKKLASSEKVDAGGAALGKNLDDLRDYDCPKCGMTMVRLADPQQPHIRYEACSVCYGVFFDAGEFLDFKDYSPKERLSAMFGLAKKP